MSDLQSYEELCAQIQAKKPLALTRWGDGEWFNIAKRVGSNTDDCIYYPDLGDELKKIVSIKQPYYMARRIDKHCAEDANGFHQNWIQLSASLFANASRGGNLPLFLDVLSQAHVVYIGNKFLGSLPFINEFVEIPIKNVWLERDRVLHQIRNTMTDEIKVFCFSAGTATNVFIHQLWETHPNNIYLDVGSVFDPYVGRSTRSYHKKLKLTETY